MAYNAEDLKHALRICFQPAIMADKQLLESVLASSASDFVAEGVTERRVRNAASVVYVDPDTLEMLIRIMNVLRAT